MCGIFGYVGKRKDAGRIVFEGIKRLEYRGYDSWGIVAKATSNRQHVTSNKLFIEKHVGKIGDSSLNPKLLTLNSNLALGHTRWATHGGVTKANAHPHLDCTKRIALVHNGIVDNYQELKKILTKSHRFASETDTEIIVHLIEDYAKDNPLPVAVRKAFNRLRGLNAIVAVSDSALVAAKNGSPLVIGLGKGENFIASDPSALLPLTKKAIFLEDGQLAVVGNNKVEIFSLTGAKVKNPQKTIIDWKVEDVTPGKYGHFMHKEIYEQPKVLRAILAKGEQIKQLADVVKKAKGTFFIGCGTASYAALSGTYLFSSVAGEHVNFSIGSEFNYLEDYLNRESLIIAISQSGETIDIVQPVIRAGARGAKIVALTNVVGSTLYRLADYKIMLAAGPELAVCATKSFVAMIANLIWLAYTIAGKGEEGRKVLEATTVGVEKILTPAHTAKLKSLAKKLKEVEHIYVIGRGLSYPTALEATLKLKEVPYVHSEGFAGGELKHGVIALIEKGTPTIVFAPNDETHDDIISNAIEIKSRGGYIIGVSPQNNEAFDFWLPVVDVAEGSVIVNTVPIQLLAYYMALAKGLDPDKPRNLAKSVTVK